MIETAIFWLFAILSVVHCYFTLQSAVQDGVIESITIIMIASSISMILAVLYFYKHPHVSKYYMLWVMYFAYSIPLIIGKILHRRARKEVAS